MSEALYVLIKFPVSKDRPQPSVPYIFVCMYDEVNYFDTFTTHTYMHLSTLKLTYEVIELRLIHNSKYYISYIFFVTYHLVKSCSNSISSNPLMY